MRISTLRLGIVPALAAAGLAMLVWFLAANPVSAESWGLHCPSNMKEGASQTA